MRSFSARYFAGMNELLKHKQVDRLLQLPFGKTLSLAREGKIPHIVLPNGEIRFDDRDIEKLIEKGRRGVVAAHAVDLGAIR